MAEIKELFVTYSIEGEDGVRITAEINNENGTITLKTFQNNTEFKFINSKPEMIKAVAGLMVKAANLVSS